MRKSAYATAGVPANLDGPFLVGCCQSAEFPQGLPPAFSRRSVGVGVAAKVFIDCHLF